jgi:hypothetical protein
MAKDDRFEMHSFQTLLSPLLDLSKSPEKVLQFLLSPCGLESSASGHLPPSDMIKEDATIVAATSISSKGFRRMSSTSPSRKVRILQEGEVDDDSVSEQSDTDTGSQTSRSSGQSATSKNSRGSCRSGRSATSKNSRGSRRRKHKSELADLTSRMKALEKTRYSLQQQVEVKLLNMSVGIRKLYSD